MKCRLCNSDSTKLLFNKNYNSQDWEIYSCNNCSVQFIPESSSDAVEDNHEKYDDALVYGDPDNFPYYYKHFQGQRIKLIERLLKDNKNKKILDIGCNIGVFLGFLSAEYDRYGVEISEAAAKIAQERGINAFAGEIQDSPFPAQSFDIITMYAVIEHLSDPGVVIETISKLLKKGGLLVISTGNVNSLTAKLAGQSWHLYTPGEHQYFFTPKSLDYLVKPLGYDLVYQHSNYGKSNLIAIPVVGKLIDQISYGLERTRGLRNLPLFHHMYRYYIKEN